MFAEVMAGGLKATVIQQANMTQIEMRRQLQVFLDHDLHVFFILITSGWEVKKHFYFLDNRTLVAGYFWAWTNYV